MNNVAINGFGRIGRLVFRALLNDKESNVVAINDLTDNKTLAHLLKYDSVHGTLKQTISHTEESLIIDDKEIKVFSEKDPAALPWKEMKVDYIIEATGVFRSRDKAAKHLAAGARKVLITAPAKDEIDATIVIGVNDKDLKKEHVIVSNASCTTNCLAPIAKVIHDNFGIVSGLMSTVHSYTNDQRILDFPHTDLRRARAAGVNLIPTSTGAAKATGLVIPDLKGRFDGLAVRTPTPDGSLVDLSILLEQEVSVADINSAVKKASETTMKGVIEYSEAALVLTDIIGNSHSAIFDAPLTMVSGKLAKVIAWYDNEWGYSVRVADLLKMMINLDQ